MQNIIKEFRKLQNNDFKLNFRYPTESERDQIKIIHRDMTVAERKRVESNVESLASLVEDLDAGKIHMEDLNPDPLNRLNVLLGNVERT